MPVASFDAMLFFSSNLKLRHSSGLSAAGFDSSACAAVLCTAQMRAQYAYAQYAYAQVHCRSAVDSRSQLPTSRRAVPLETQGS